MRSKWTAIGLSLAAVIMLAAGDPNSTIVIDDFDDGDAEGWDLNSPTGLGISYVNEEGEYVIESIEPIPLDHPFAGIIESHWEPAEGQPRFSSGTLRGTIRANTFGTTAGFFVREGDDPIAGSRCCTSTGFGTFYISRVDRRAVPPITLLAMADPAQLPFFPDEDWDVEAGFVGHRLWMKA
ncbi:hypothetical protein ElP_71550 (plasmid) [Tautonia plasticadhaerens]|uniref:PEP-CTERM sorting domain-containing protein n=2 Tax=Tautonia plasticadhaerens TaxID=2527974 RepID=A0A518HEC1_9BACT|nr:hypothetical protein ElP_71550 [Tautonia plasticadhaerens]